MRSPAHPEKNEPVTARTTQNHAWIETAGASAELTLIDDGIVHVLWRPTGEWKSEPTRHVDCEPRSGLRWRLHRPRRTLVAGPATIAFSADPVRLRFSDSGGTFLAESTKGPFGYLDNGVVIPWELSRTERIYGLGQNAFVPLNRVGQRRAMAADHAGTIGGDVPISFWVSSRGYGVAVDNPSLATFDLTRKGRITFHAADGYISYYVLWGPTPADVLRRYAALTGRASMPPRWLLGPMFSRIPESRLPGYRSDREMLALADKLRRRGIPADTLILDFQWEQRVGALRWDPKRFRHAKDMVRQLDRKGIQTILILKPAANLDACTATHIRRSGMALQRTDGSVHDCQYHRGRSMFLDFFREPTRRWYAEQLDRLSKDGVAGWWTDEGDWLGYLSKPIRDLVRSPAAMRNLYNNAWCRAIYEGERSRGDRRVVNLTRSGWLGIQRYGTSVWSGDVSATWKGLASQLQMGLNMGLSGVPFWTTDGGGFIGNPTPELYVRWAQFAAFSPLARFHGCGPREPWHYGPEAEAAVRAVLEWRMRLMPYLYATAWQAHSLGLPMMRAMALVAPDDRRFADLASQYFLGASLLVRPITDPLATLRRRGSKVRTELLPGRWYDFWTGREVTPERTSQPAVTTGVTLASLPVYVRAPAVVVLAGPAANTREQSWENLTVRVYTGDMRRPWQAGFDLHEDDGATCAYEKGESRITHLTAQLTTNRSIALTFAPAGGHPRRVAVRRRWRIEIVGISSRPNVVEGRRERPMSQQGLIWTYDAICAQPTAKKVITITL